MLDATLREIQPRRYVLPQDQPKKRADHRLLSRPVVAYLEALIDTALAYSGALNADEDPREVLCGATGLSDLEYEAVMLWGGGSNWEKIAKEQCVSAERAEVAAKEGVKKLRRFVQE